MSWQATNWVIEHSRHKGSTLLVLLCIANCANEDGSDCWPTRKRLAKDTRMSERQLDRVIASLEQSGELVVRRSGGRFAHHYAFPLMQPNVDKLSRLATPQRNVDKLSSNVDISRTNVDTAMSTDPSIEQSIEQRPPLPPVPVPTKEPPAAPYQSNDFKEALAAFEQHRKEIKHPLTPTARAALYVKLKRFGETVAIRQLYESIENGWQGVFEPKSNGNHLPTQAEMNRGGTGKLVI